MQLACIQSTNRPLGLNEEFTSIESVRLIPDTLQFVCTHTERGLTLVVQLEDAHASLRRGAVEDGQRVGGTADHLTFDQQRLVGQDQQGPPVVHAPDRQLLALRQVHILHLNTHIPSSLISPFLEPVILQILQLEIRQNGCN